jgi:hypothetical protein
VVHAKHIHPDGNSNIHNTDTLLTKLAGRSWLKLYLHAADASGQVEGANQDLQDCVRIFQVSSTAIMTRSQLTE